MRLVKKFTSVVMLCIVIALIGLLVAFATIGMMNTFNPPVKGDVNGDGVVSIADYTLIRLHLLGLKDLES